MSSINSPLYISVSLDFEMIFSFYSDASRWWGSKGNQLHRREAIINVSLYKKQDVAGDYSTQSTEEKAHR